MSRYPTSGSRKESSTVVSAVTPYLEALERLDRYQIVDSANQVYDDEARKKLLDKMNRIASNLGVDEVIAGAAQAHLKKIGEIPADERARVTGRGGPCGFTRTRGRGERARDISCGGSSGIRILLLESLVTH